MEQEIRVAIPRVGLGLDAIEAALCSQRVSPATVLDPRIVAEEVLTNVAARDG